MLGPPRPYYLNLFIICTILPNINGCNINNIHFLQHNIYTFLLDCKRFIFNKLIGSFTIYLSGHTACNACDM